MKLQTVGTDTSDIEIVNIGTHGFWLYVKGKEYFLPYTDYPWFKDGKVSDIINVKLLHGFHLFWLSLDVDIDLHSLEVPDKYPLIYRE